MKKIEDLFPLKGFITAEIIKTANIKDTKACIGALTLQDALRKKIDPSDFETSWGSYSGTPLILDQVATIGTEEDINLMYVTEPQEITFILKDVWED